MPSANSKCQLESRGLYCGDSTGYNEPRSEAPEASASRRQLFLELDNDEEAGMRPCSPFCNKEAKAMRKNSRIGLFAVGIVLCLGAVILAAPPESELPEPVGPYLQSPSVKGMTVCFAARSISAAQVELKEIGATDKRVYTATPTPIPDTSWTVWKTKLDHLKPGSEYEYLVHYRREDAAHSTKTYHFLTLDPKAQTIKAAFFNDIHEKFPTLEAIMKHCKPEDYDFSVLMGDCWQNPQNADRAIEVLNHYIQWLDAGEKPMLFVRGNHECRGPFADRLGYLFDLPNLSPAAPVGEQQYSFTLHAGPVWFLAMDCGEDFEKMFDVMQPYRKRQAEWLETLLKKNDHKNAPWRVMLSHLPLYNDNIWNSEPSRRMWEPILSHANIDLALSGHDHTYKVLEQGKTLKVTHDPKYTENRGEWEMTPPYPQMIGGGPDSNLATVMLLKADANTLQIRMIEAEGGTVCKEINSTKNALRSELEQ